MLPKSRSLQSLAQLWSIEIPTPLSEILGLKAGEVEIFSLEDLLEDAYRTSDMPARFLPFAYYPELLPSCDEWTIGLYLPRGTGDEHLEVTAYAEGRMIPFASNLPAALYRIFREQ